jgi:hypothetical protein
MEGRERGSAAFDARTAALAVAAADGTLMRHYMNTTLAMAAFSSMQSGH